MADWYVRPDTSHSGTRNGQSYATAWGGWSEISWASMAQTDTLIVCGAHSYAATITINGGGVDANNRRTIRGDHQDDPATVSLTAPGALVNVNQNNIRILNLAVNAIDSALYLGAGRANVTVEQCALVSSGEAKHAIQLAPGNGLSLTNIQILGSTILATGNGVNWAPGSAISTSIETLVLADNNISAGLSAIHLFNGSSGTVGISGLDIDSNVIRAETMCGLRLYLGQDASLGSALNITNNDIRYCGAGGNGAAGGIVAVGFTDVRITGNNCSENFGVYGGMNPQFCKNLTVEDNICNNNFSNDIDGNGILIDNGCENVVVTRNECAGNDRSTDRADNVFGGAGIMVLSANGVRVYGNHGSGNRVGFHIGFWGAPQNVTIHNNTFTECRVAGLDSGGTNGDATAITLKNNILTGGATADYAIDNSDTNQMQADYNCLYGFSSGNRGQTAGANDISADPLLIGLLPSLSACVGGGTPVDCTATDFYGHRFAAHPTIGAVEIKRTVCLRM